MDMPFGRGHSLACNSPTGGFTSEFFDRLDVELAAFHSKLTGERSFAEARLDARHLCEKVTHGPSPSIGIEKYKLLQPDWEETWRESKQVYTALFSEAGRWLTREQQEHLYQAFRQLVRFVAEGTTEYIRGALIGDLRGAVGKYLSLRGFAPAPDQPAPAITRKKRSTVKGEAREKMIGALTLHHKYAQDSCLNLEPIGNNELARLAQVSKAIASAFFSKEFKGHKKYQALCGDTTRLVAVLKLLNQEISPHDLYGRRPPGEDERGDEE